MQEVVKNQPAKCVSRLCEDEYWSETTAKVGKWMLPLQNVALFGFQSWIKILEYTEVYFALQNFSFLQPRTQRCIEFGTRKNISQPSIM